MNSVQRKDTLHRDEKERERERNVPSFEMSKQQ